MPAAFHCKNTTNSLDHGRALVRKYASILNLYFSQLLPSIKRSAIIFLNDFPSYFVGGGNVFVSVRVFGRLAGRTTPTDATNNVHSQRQDEDTQQRNSGNGPSAGTFLVICGMNVGLIAGFGVSVISARVQSKV